MLAPCHGLHAFVVKEVAVGVLHQGPWVLRKEGVYYFMTSFIQTHAEMTSKCACKNVARVIFGIHKGMTISFLSSDTPKVAF